MFAPQEVTKTSKLLVFCPLILSLVLSRQMCTANRHVRISYEVTGTIALHVASNSLVTVIGGSAELSPDHCRATSSNPGMAPKPVTWGHLPAYQAIGGR